MKSDPFLNPPLCRRNLDRYVVRKGILEAMTRYRSQFKGRFLDVGAGNQPYRTFLSELPSEVTEYVPLDLHDNFQYQDAEVTWDGRTMPFSDNGFDTAMATEVLEHCPEPEVTLGEVARVLKPGGLFFFTVPFLWPLHDCPHDEYRYTPWSLERHLRNSGFEQIEIRPTGGWDAALAQALGLWVARGSLGRWQRRIFGVLILPVYRWLLARDRAADSFDKRGYLMPGLAGTARVRKSENT